ncbi:protein polybromo-1 isoform X2 [Culicoides brevitarsis]|uniref:protein polybromo-1 isoform X2 n=1 Tax=Culicoides brevitarsis TaxID=469753 RepID=UPI00307B82ED
MSKRRIASRASSVATESSEEYITPDVAPSTRKRKKLDGSEQCQQCYDAIRNFKKEDGTTICDVFVRVPKRRTMPEYYEVVTDPIDLLKIQQKIKTDGYSSLTELQTDIELLVENAKAFYKPDSEEYEDAVTLWEVFQTQKKKVEETNGSGKSSVEPVEDEPKGKTKPPTSSRPRRTTTLSAQNGDDDDIDVYEELFAAVMTATDTDDRPLHTMFQLLPSKKLYPEYYQVIEHPIDLKFIANKIQTNAYENLTEMEKDLSQMTKNACLFNKPGSQIYKDAKTLRKIFTSKKIELESGRSIKTQQNKKPSQALSAQIAALEDEQDGTDDENNEEEDEDEGPMRQLFDILYNTATTNGAPLGESFWKLPNKRFNPDYYTTIKKPISMGQIRNKMIKGEYANITDMTSDLFLMLDNAKKWFPSTNRVYKDAEKMRKLLNQKLVDGSLDQDDSDEENESEEEEESEEESSEDEQIIKKPTRKSSIASSTPAKPLLPASGSKSVANNPAMKKKLLAIHEHLIDFTVDGRAICINFLEKPSKKLYPDYYKVIAEPIDMQIIENRITQDKYETLDDVLADYQLLFSNCRKYNEVKSQIYQDANTLEKALKKQIRELSGVPERKSIQRPHPSSPRTPKRPRIVTQRCQQLFETIRDYKEPKAKRQLSTIFLKLPSKADYPDYYEIIKHPIDMDRIQAKINKYNSLDEIVQDFALMFENACTYNEPDSQIYKDALALQQICAQTKQKLRDMDNLIPDVQSAVQEILLSLFTAVYNLEDEEGRCLSDSLAELPEYDQDGDEGDKKVRAISLDLIKRRLDKGLYKRLDAFQEDLFMVLDRARRLSRTDSQVFEDSIEMQLVFLKKRDELCKNGDILQSPALLYTISQFNSAVEELRQSKQLEEQKDEAPSTEEETSQEPLNVQEPGESMTIDEQKYSPGDFVYYELPENDVPGIIYITRLYTDSENVQMMEGNTFFRPYETYHIPTRRFMEQEVFKTDQHLSVPLSKIKGRCFVMCIRDYIQKKPEGFEDKDVYVCESRYQTRARSFKKIKIWNNFNADVRFTTREEPLEINRVQSVFKNKSKEKEAPKEEINFELDLALDTLEKQRPNVVLNVEGAEDGNTYYEQFNTVAAGVVKTGDFVYVATEAGKQCVAQICSIWESKEGKSFFRGPWLLNPLEIPSSLIQTCYKQELMLSTVQETTQTASIVGRCCVLEYLDYSTRRATEIPESDVFICESIYDEMKKQLNKISQPGAIRKFTHSKSVTPDEIYHFKRAITPQKDMKIENGELVCVNDTSATEDDLDASLPDTPNNSQSSYISTPNNKNKPGGRHNRGKVVTGYILYSSEQRKDRCELNPGMSFGEISRMLGDEWRNMDQKDRSVWEDKAAKLNEAAKIKWREENAHLMNQPPDPNALTPGQGFLQNRENPIPNQIFDCRWRKCDFQFEDPADLLDHCITEKDGCLQRHLNQTDEKPEFYCLWRSCVRFKRGAPPFPNSMRLLKHVRDIHVYKHMGKMVKPHDRNKNFVPRRTPLLPKPKIENDLLMSPLSHKQYMPPPPHQQPHMTHQIPNQMGYYPPQQQPGQQQFMQHPAYQPYANGQQMLTQVPNQTAFAPQMQQPSLLQFAAPQPDPLFVSVPPRPQRVLHSDAYIKYIEGLQANTPSITPYERAIEATEMETAPPLPVSRLPGHWLGKAGREKPDDVVNALWNLRNYMMKDVVQLYKSY